MAASFQFDKTAEFSPGNADEILRSIPAQPGVFALYGKQENSEPYLTRAADLRRRMKRLLAPPESQSKRLNLRDRVARIEYTVTGSEFESTLTLYHATAAIFGYAEARRRLRLHTPAFLRLATENEFPRLYVTNRLSKRGLAQTYGPFPSRAAAERYCDAVLDLFKLRRCHEDLAPYPEHPGCVYGEMKKCIEPCKQACTAEEYAAEASAVKAFLDSRGESVLERISREREKASEEMEFEKAAQLHEQHQKVKAAAALADELVQPVPELRAIMVQKAAAIEEREDEAAVFLLAAGCIVGPERLSTLGVRAVKEQTSVGSSLFAQPLMLAPVPLEGEAAEAADAPEDRARKVIGQLEQRVSAVNDLALLSDHLSLFRRWYYRPEKQRVGEVFLPNPDGGWPVRRILRGAARQVLGEPKPLPDVQREAAKKTRVLHKGRPDVERVVPVVNKE
ncbi:UvrB/UvrC motif-containing protein [Edaphobacter sp. 12200R-103]|uniref:UvrB/UvrC motif-containing protein n=1 Tax=Edaphobacter sp. 12200R-103 TaxID=2703788 RepID=UPI00138D2B76|nr:UvrB/UvrC motif-containing protein [Edaphobacter sp. 12200R-103]QHS52040.1 excinuclease ABC subunit C [Edaphobacter sp. 12200R-103]